MAMNRVKCLRVVVGFLVATATSALGLTACSDSGSVVAVSSVGDVRERSARGTARVRMGYRVDRGELSASWEMEGVVDLGTGDSAMTTIDDTVVAADAAAGVPAEIRIVGRVQYLRVPGIFKSGDQQWVRQDLSGLLEAIGGAESDGLADPLEEFEELASTPLREVSQEVLRGDRVTKYEVEIDPAKLAEAQSEQLGFDVPARGDLSERPITIWVDGEGRPRKIESPLRQPVEYWDYGVDVEIAAPPAADTIDIAEIDDEDLVRRPTSRSSPLTMGPWELKREGEWEDVRWQHWVSTRSDGRRCFTFETTPYQWPDLTPAVMGENQHDGYLAECDGSPITVYEGGSWSVDTPLYSVTAGVTRGMDTIELTYDDGTAERLPVDPETGLFYVFRREPRNLTEARNPERGYRCTYEGTGRSAKVNCGAK